MSRDASAKVASAIDNSVDKTDVFRNSISKDTGVSSRISDIIKSFRSTSATKNINDALSSTVDRKSSISEIVKSISNKYISEVIQSFVSNVLKNPEAASPVMTSVHATTAPSEVVGHATGTKTTWPHMAMVGEDGPAHPEYIIPTKTKRWDLLSQVNHAYGIPGYAKGTSTGDEVTASDDISPDDSGNWLGSTTKIDAKLDGIAENTGDALPCMMKTEANTAAASEKLDKVDENVCHLQSAIQNMGANIVSATANVAGAWGANGGTGGRYGSFFGGSSWISGGAAGVGAGWDKEPDWGGEAASDRASGKSSSTMQWGLAPIFMAKGGLTNGPEFFMDRGKLSVRGEAGPELILPLSDPERTNELLHRYLPRKFATGGIVDVSNTIASRKNISETIITSTNKLVSDEIRKFVSILVEDLSTSTAAIDGSVSSKHVTNSSPLMGVATGTKTSGPELAVIGEDGPSNPEYVIPTKTKRWDLMFAAMRSYGIPGYAKGTSTAGQTIIPPAMQELGTRPGGIRTSPSAMGSLVNSDIYNQDQTNNQFWTDPLNADNRLPYSKGGIHHTRAGDRTEVSKINGNMHNSVSNQSSIWNKSQSWWSPKTAISGQNYYMPPVRMSNEAYVKSPTLAVVGDRPGGEYVIGAARFENAVGKGGGVTVNLTQNINGSGLSASELAGVIERSNQELVAQITSKMSEAARN